MQLPDWRDLAYTGFSAFDPVLLRILLSPTLLLAELGFGNLAALRLTSIILSSISIVILYRVTIKGQSRNIFYYLIAFLIIFPSWFIWNTLGLREPYLIFSIMLITIGLEKLRVNQHSKGVILIILALFIAFNTKFYLTIAILFGLFFYIIVLFAIRQQIIKKISVGTYSLLTLVAGSLSLVILSFIPTGAINAIPSTNFNLTTSSVIDIPKNSEDKNSENRGTTMIAFSECLKVNESVLISSLNRFVFKIQTEGPTVTPESDSDSSNSAVTKKFYVNKELLKAPSGLTRGIALFPAGASLYLFHPSIYDSGLLQKLSGIESTAVLALILLNFLLIIRNRRLSILQLRSSLFHIPFSIFLILLGMATEVNVGTILRHKEMVLMSLFIILMENIRAQRNLPNISEPEIKLQ